jgi:hypothetical protein
MGFGSSTARGPAARSDSFGQRPTRLLLAFLLLATALSSPTMSRAQVSYLARFVMDKQQYLPGEPIFCNFSIRNTGAQTFAFSYRSPSRLSGGDDGWEPRFRVADTAGRQPADPAPKPCGGAKGSVVYGSVTLPPGQTHTERWLLNQWARISTPGAYRVRATRRLPLLTLDPATREFSKKPVAYALASDELSFDVAPASKSQLEALFRPYVRALDDSSISNPAEAVLVVTTLPHPFLLPELKSMASASAHDRWDRKLALEGLARLGTPDAWQAVLSIARAEASGGKPSSAVASSGKDETLRAYAIRLLAEKGDATFLPALLELVSAGPEELRGDALRALGSFRDPRAYQTLFEKLHSTGLTDRMNAILGLKDLGSKDSLPALLAMLNDPDAQVRQVANYALQSLTGQRFNLSSAASREESARAAKQWHAWWQEHSGSFVPVRLPPCQDW